MKRSFVAVFMLSLLVIGGFAGAADAADTGHHWTGFYIGLNAGAAINDSHYDLSPGKGYEGDPDNPLRSDSGEFDDTSFTGGVQAGYNYQINNFVIGIETDFNYNGVDESDHVDRALAAPLGGQFIHTVKQEIDYFGTLRARAGFTPTDTLLVYATGGLAYGRVRSSSHVQFDVPVEDNYSGSKSSTQTGWTIGGGLEYALSCNWSIKAEYLYVDLGSQSYSSWSQDPICGNDCSYTTDLKTRENVVRFGINYKF
jgi:outer membrane immunogenic protein